MTRIVFACPWRQIQRVRIDLYLADVRNLRPDLHAILKVRDWRDRRWRRGSRTV